MKTRGLMAAALLAALAFVIFPRPDGGGRQETPGSGLSRHGGFSAPPVVADNAPVESDGSASEAATESAGAPGTFPGKRLPGAEVIDSEVRRLERKLVEEVRLTRRGASEGLIRWVERRRTDPVTGETEILHTEAMAGDRLLVLVDSDDGYSRLRAFAEERGFALSDRLDFSRVVRLTIPGAGPASVPDALAELAAASLEDVTAEPDTLYFPAKTPNDPSINLQWGLANVQAFDAWDVETGSGEVYVAVLDSGIDRNHPDLFDNIAHDLGRNFASDGSNTAFDDQSGHGTGVSGTIGAVGDNGIGVAGLAWKTRIIPIRVGNDTFSTSSIITGLEYITDLRENHGLHVVATNNSYGTESPTNRGGFRKAIADSAAAGILFVAAAGNDGIDMDAGNEFYPAAFDEPNIVAVAATRPDDTLWPQSNYGSSIVHLAAPGEGIHTTRLGNTYASMSGTSLATPFVAGTFALMASAAPDLGMADLKTALLETVDPLPALDGRTVTGGRLNTNRAVRAAARLIHLRWATPSAAFLRLPDTGADLRLRVRGEREGVQEALAPENLSWETSEGPAEVAFRPAGDPAAALARFPDTGLYRLRAVYLDDGERRESREITVAVGRTSGPPDEDLLAHWAFDEDGGGELPDLSGNGRHGELDTAARDAGLLGGALRFDGDQGRATVSAPRTERIAISAWVKSASPGQSEISLPRILETDEHILFWGRMNGQYPNNNTVKFVANRDSEQGEFGVWHTDPGAIDDGEWIHIAVSYDGSSTGNRPSVYIDGREHSVDTQVFPSGPRPADGEAPAWLGNNESRDRAWHGVIDEVRIYGEPLSSGALAGFAYPAPVARPDFEMPVIAGEEHPFSATAAYPENAVNAPAFTWNQVSGPGEVTFTGGDGAVAATFSEPGEYTLSLTADDNRAATGVEFTVDVVREAPAIHVEAGRDATLWSPLYPIEVRFVADHVLEEDLTVPFELGGDAVAGEDYDLDPEGTAEIVISQGDREAALTLIPRLPDPVPPASKTFRIGISDPALADSPASVEVALLPQTYTNWSAFFFEGQPAGDGRIDAPEIDYTGDGVTNLVKYALGLDPLAPANRDEEPYPRFLTVDLGDDTYGALAFVRPLGLDDIEYRVEVSDDPRDASWNADDTTTHEAAPLGSGRERVIVRDLHPLDDGSKRFLRLKVLIPDDDS